MWHLNYGGAEVGLLTTLRKIDKNCFSCKVICIEGSGPIGEEIKKIGIDVEYLNSSARPWSLRTLIRLIKALKNKKIDILHTSLFYANFFGRIASFFVKIPVVVCEERSMYTEKKFYHIILDRMLSSFTDKIIVCSKSVLNFTVKQEKIKKDKFCLIYNVVDKERFDIKEKKDELRKKYSYS